MSDVVALFWINLSAFAVIRARSDSRARWIALAAFALGWAVMTRWVYAMLIPVWILAALTLPSRESFHHTVIGPIIGRSFANRTASVCNRNSAFLARLLRNWC